MPAKRTNIVVCPSCGVENIQGTDSCEKCLMDLRTMDVPETHQVVAESDFTIPISTVRMTKPRVIDAGRPVAEALALMKDDPTGSVVVLESNRVAGILTDRDVLKKVADQPGVRGGPVASVMTADPVVLREDDTMATALNKMGDGGFRHMPVVRDGELVGMITGRDVMNWVLGRYFE